MAAKKVMIEEVSKDLFIIQQTSPLVKMIEFGYILHSFMVDSEMAEENEWFDFAFGVNLKILESHDEIVLFNSSEIETILDWLDWICKVIVTSEGVHNETNFIKHFLSKSDYLFKSLKSIKVKEKIIVEKLK